MAIFAKKQDTRRKDAKKDAKVDAAITPIAGDLQGVSGGPSTVDSVKSGVDAQAPSAPPVEAAASPSADSVEVPISTADEALVAQAIEIDSDLMDSDFVEAWGGPDEGAAFGVGDAIRLMRSLPTDTDPELVVRVVRLTLGAVDVSVEDILQEAALKERRLRESLGGLRAQADELEKQLHARRSEIALQEADLQETTTIRERLRHATNQGHRPPPTPADAMRNSPHKPAAWASE